MVVANGTFVNTSIIASGVGNVYVIGVEDQVVVNLAGTAAVSIGADSSKLTDSSGVARKPSTVHSWPSAYWRSRVHPWPSCMQMARMCASSHQGTLCEREACGKRRDCRFCCLQAM